MPGGETGILCAVQLERTEASPGDHSASCVTRLRPGSMTTKRLESASASSASSFTTASASVEQAVRESG